MIHDRFVRSLVLTALRGVLSQRRAIEFRFQMHRLLLCKHTEGGRNYFENNTKCLLRISAQRQLTAAERIYFKMNWKVFSHEKVKALISGVCNDSQHIHSWSKTELSAEQGFWEGISFNQGRIPAAGPVRGLRGITFFVLKCIILRQDVFYSLIHIEFQMLLCLFSYDSLFFTVTGNVICPVSLCIEIRFSYM